MSISRAIWRSRSQWSEPGTLYRKGQLVAPCGGNRSLYRNCLVLCYFCGANCSRARRETADRRLDRPDLLRGRGDRSFAAPVWFGRTRPNFVQRNLFAFLVGAYDPVARNLTNFDVGKPGKNGIHSVASHAPRSISTFAPGGLFFEGKRPVRGARRHLDRLYVNRPAHRRGACRYRPV